MGTIFPKNPASRKMSGTMLSILVIVTMAFANTGFQVQAAPRALPADWDASAVLKASVLKDGDLYKMWYDGIDAIDQMQIGLATSADGLFWAKDPNNPVLSGGSGAWDSSGEHAPFVMKDGGVYKMWYEGSNGSVRQLGYATSPDGIHWTKFGGNPVLQAGPQGYDNQVAGHGSVIYEAGVYKLWYHAIGNQGIIIAYATSADGIGWTKLGPVLLQQAGLWDANGLWGPSVLKVADTYWMWYSAHGPTYPASIGAATSPDGVHWTRIGNAPVLTITDRHIGDPHVILDGGVFKMWFTNFVDGRIYYASSADGIHWSEPRAVLGPGDSQTFEDVPLTYWARDFIGRLYNAGITGGCGVNPLRYCPEGTVTRAQMAVFLERGIHGSAYNPPAVGTGTGFTDVPLTYWAASWIKQLAADGITGGCGTGAYCPEAPVTRAQMAVFLLRSKHGASYTPPAVGASTGFSDMPPGYWAAAWIKQLVAEGITSGCGTGTYCPEAPVTRAQMAVFLVRTFDLP